MRHIVCTLALLLTAIAAAHAKDHLGRNLAATCANCHGTNGKTQGQAVASLAGQSAEQIVTKMAEFKEGKRPATIMHQISKGFSDEQVKLIAEYFAQQK